MSNTTQDSNQGRNQGRGSSTPKKGTKSGHQRHAKPKPSAPLTPEQEAKIKAAEAAAKAAAEQRAKCIGEWEKWIATDKLSFRQLRGELKRVKRGRFLGEPASLLSVAEAIVSDIVLVNTKTRENLAGQLSHYLNPATPASSPKHTL